jgi:hypothetical protein
MLNKLAASDFIKHLNSFFQLSSDSGVQIEAELIEVTDLRINESSVDGNIRRHPFSVVFTGPLQPLLPQGTYQLKHAEMEPLLLFLVPIGPDNKGMRYEAVFN